MDSSDRRQANLRTDLEADFEETNELDAPDDQPETPNKFWEFNGSVLAFLVGVVALEGLMFLISTPEVPLWSTMPFFLIPFLILVLCTWFWHAKITTFGSVIQQFLVGVTFVTSCVCIAQMMLIGFWIVFVMGVDDSSVPLSPSLDNYSLFNDTFLNITYSSPAVATDDENTWLDVMTFLFLSLVALPLPECAATYLVTVQSNRANHHNKNFVINSMYIGLGYATGESLLGLISQALRHESRYARTLIPEVTWYELLLWAFNYLVMSAPLQMLVGYGIGLLVAEAREKNKTLSGVRCNAVAWVVRAVYYILYCGWIFVEFWNVWVFIGGALVEALLFIVWIKRVEKTMPAEYLAKVGYLHVFGYGVISQVEDLGERPATAEHEMSPASSGQLSPNPNPGAAPVVP